LWSAGLSDGMMPKTVEGKQLIIKIKTGKFENACGRTNRAVRA